MRNSIQTQQTVTPQTDEERITALRQTADRILHRVRYGQCADKERTELLRQYEIIDRILLRRGTADGDKNAPIYKLLERLDREAGLIE